MHYGGRRHIECLTDVLNALGSPDELGTRSPELQDALDALHAALLCHMRPVRRPPDLVTHLGESVDWRAAYPVACN